MLKQGNLAAFVISIRFSRNNEINLDGILYAINKYNIVFSEMFLVRRMLLVDMCGGRLHRRYGVFLENNFRSRRDAGFASVTALDVAFVTIRYWYFTIESAEMDLR